MASDPTALLSANLRVLGNHDARLVERLAWPVDDAHVVQGTDGSFLLRRHHSLLPLEQDPTRVRSDLDAMATEKGHLLVFGIGLGEGLRAALTDARWRRVVAFERDPWLLRLTLQRIDLREAMASERLTLILGVGLLNRLEKLRSWPRLDHALLGTLYEDERTWLSDGVATERALVARGGLFIDDLTACLRDRGRTTVPIALESWSESELEETVRASGARELWAINYTQGLAEFCARMELALRVWEIDPATDVPRPLACASDHAVLATFRRANLEAWRDAGFERVVHLPLAANTQHRSPRTLTAEEADSYTAPVAFVGSSMSRQAREHHARFLELYCAWHPRRNAARDEGEGVLRSILTRQRADPSRYLIPELARELLGPFLEAIRASEVPDDPLMLLGEIAGAEKRLTYVANLGCYGIQVWGDDGWRAAERGGARWRGRAGHRDELNRVYAGARVHVDIGRIYQQDIVTMRVFDVLACGGFLIAEHGDELDELFEVGVELESYRTLPELVEKVGHYLEHPRRARAIAERGLEAVRARHTIAGRVATLLQPIA